MKTMFNRLIQKIKFRFGKEVWLHVKQIVVHAQVEHQPQDKAFYLNLSESNKGNRRCVLTSSWPGMKENDIYYKNQLTAYHTLVIPWLSGRRNLDIPTYAECPEDDVMTILRGK